MRFFKAGKAAAALCAAFAAVLMQAVCLCAPAHADSIYTAVLVDLDSCIPDSKEQELVEYMQKTADTIECNVGVVITADLNGMYYISYADNFSDTVFGTGTSSVVLMLLNTHGNPEYASYTDWISTSGRARDYYDGKTNKIFDKLYEGLDSSGFEQAVTDYCDALVRYKGIGGITFEVNLGAVIADFFIPAFIGLVLSLAITHSIAKKYTKKSPVSAANYIDNVRTANTVKTDVFVKEYTRTYTNSSSSSGHRSHGGGGGHHRSGGHGGGGGRHR